MTENERFEIINMLYYRETGHYRPGKSSLTEDTSSQQNIDRFALFCMENLLNRALESILERDCVIDGIRKIAEFAPEITAKQADFCDDILKLNNAMISIREILVD